MAKQRLFVNQQRRDINNKLPSSLFGVKPILAAINSCPEIQSYSHPVNVFP